MISLFYSPDALGVTEKQIGCTVGTIGTCGFESHDFIYGIVPDAKPKNLSEIINDWMKTVGYLANENKLSVVYPTSVLYNNTCQETSPEILNNRRLS
jgi:DNA polymerase III alpha subunit (gram-positive type)